MRRLAPAAPALLAALAPLAALALGGCGAPPPPAEGGRGPTAGPPTWSAVREEQLPDATLIDVRADAPCRLRLEVRGTEARRDAAGERLLAAGESVRLWFSVRGQAQLPSSSVLPPEALAAGRTEPQGVVVAYGFIDGPAQRRLIVLGTRPGAARPLAPVVALPPQAPQPLPLDGELELGAVGVVDGGPPGVTLVGGDGGARLKGGDPTQEAGQAQIVRLVLRVERMARE